VVEDVIRSPCYPADAGWGDVYWSGHCPDCRCTASALWMTIPINRS